MGAIRRRIWSEFVPYDVLTRPAVLRALQQRSIGLLVAVTPEHVSGAAGMVRACRDAGVTVGIWPMLTTSEGRWASAGNVQQFCGFVRALTDRLAAADALPHELAVDLEPPIERMQRLLRRGWAPLPPPRGHEVAGHFRELVAELEARDLGVVAAVVPPAVASAAPVRQGWQRLLDTPVDDIPFARVSVMAYTSLLEGYTRGLVRRHDAVALLALLAREVRALHGERASVSLGAVGTGALGDEQTYRSVDELAEDVGLVRAAGVEDIVLFNLDGALARPPLEAWLDALVHAPAAVDAAPMSLRAAVLWQLVGALGHAGRLLARSARRHDAET